MCIRDRYMGKLGFKGSKIVSANDNLDIGKVKMLQRIVPVDEDMQVILDDRNDVWQGSKNLVFTKPFYYFKESLSSNKKERQVIEKIEVRRKEDCYLYFAGHMLQRIHKAFFEVHNKKVKVDVRDIIQDLSANILDGVCVAFSGMHSKTIPETETHEWKLVEYLGGKCSGNSEDSNVSCIITNDFRKTHKIKKAMEDGKPILHYRWIFYSQMFFTKLSQKTFDLSSVPKEKIEDKDHIEASLITDNKELIDAEDARIVQLTIDKFTTGVKRTEPQEICQEDFKEFIEEKKLKLNEVDQ
eukprot:TRINITY_DN10058_c0_g1_i5.p1 TRINITY_DN10058_c0_g1~~TRINITY_DN10058_c0_g1_i5.p1  ORF type:complete len:298 (+),score=33.62 TRINITY_DN10058_c0_g1_i5:96-989(+)